MSAEQIIRTGNITAVFVSGIGRARASCSCGWDGHLRAFRSHAVLDAYGHGSRCPGAMPADPLIVDERLNQSLWRRLTPWPVVAASPLLLVPLSVWVYPWLEHLL